MTKLINSTLESIPNWSFYDARYRDFFNEWSPPSIIAHNLRLSEAEKELQNTHGQQFHFVNPVLSPKP